MASNEYAVTSIRPGSLLVDNILRDLESNCDPHWKTSPPLRLEDTWWVSHSKSSIKSESFLITCLWDTQDICICRYGRCLGTSGRWGDLLHAVIEYASQHQISTVWAITYNRDLGLKVKLGDLGFEAVSTGRGWSDNFSIIWRLSLTSKSRGAVCAGIGNYSIKTV